jgi:hypothetical protein
VIGSGLEVVLKAFGLLRAGLGLNPDGAFFRLEAWVRFFWAGRFDLCAARFFFGMVYVLVFCLFAPRESPSRGIVSFPPWQNFSENPISLAAIVLRRKA